MDKFGIIGWPVAHSLSPKLFSAAYGGRFSYELLGKPTFEESWKAFLDGGYRAINVTAPYKERAFVLADVKSDEAARTGAANIIVNTAEGLKAYNSDYLGVRRILDSLTGIHSACVVGFGGAGKAALAAAQDCGLDTVLLRHDGSLSAELPEEKSPQEEEGLRNRLYDGGSSAPSSCGGRCFDIVIYTLPKVVGWEGGLRCRYLLEANYKDPGLENSGIAAEYVPGKRWLLEQAVSGYALMTGIEPDTKALSEAL